MRPSLAQPTGWVLALALALSFMLPPSTHGQEAGEFVGAFGGGATLYGIDTRVDDGKLLRGTIGYTLTRNLMIEAGARWHGCFDCDRFLIAEGGVQLRYPMGRFGPFVSLGGGRASDPGFMGAEWGLHAAAGSWLWLSETWGVQLEARGRQVGVGSSDYMGEFAVGVARRFAGFDR